MTQWIGASLKWSMRQHTVATVISDGLSLQLLTVPRSRTLPPYAHSGNIPGSIGTSSTAICKSGVTVVCGGLNNLNALASPLCW
jgi:hypothetical protein